ncbi:hypothetical protein PVAND_003747 [Polypedilum vanderplanki]|uniref:Ig-like domain-containing protein n=1 Tax=Polypedilum vanderplanki TaxID=319348 RepID=A0A9J6BUZ9_POLVA|nr:hypothetical protein PVAND_003747 [Polypedilum vanderplanki]
MNSIKNLFGLCLLQIFTNNFVNVNSEMQVSVEREPSFTAPIENISVALGREALLSCYVTNLGDFKVGWMRAADQTVLALQGRVVTHNSRYSVTNEEMKIWRLKINNIREADRGCYMCQINTTPLKKQIGCIDVNLPPDILDGESSKDVTVTEGQNASLYCSAIGNPQPKIIWRREDGNPMIFKVNNKTRRTDTYEGELISFNNVNRRQMGAYLCIAKNDVPPAVSKMISLNVNFAPNVSILNEKSVHVLENTHITIDCLIEASPRTVSYWIKEPFGRSYQKLHENPHQNVLQESEKYNISESFHSYYKTTLRMKISNFSESDIGMYSCVASNIMGRANATIHLYEIKIPTTTTTTTTTPAPTTSTTRRTTFAYTTRRAYTRATTTTMATTTEVSSTEPQFEYITFNPEFNEIPGGDSYINRPHLNVAYSTSRAGESSFHHVCMLVVALMSFTKLFLLLR